MISDRLAKLGSNKYPADPSKQARESVDGDVRRHATGDRSPTTGDGEPRWPPASRPGAEACRDPHTAERQARRWLSDPPTVHQDTHGAGEARQGRELATIH